MNNHNHKEPPLREQVKHKNWLFSKFIDLAFYGVFALVLALVFAGLFE